MPISNVVTWEDFTGGYWVGALETAQPSNSWTGDNLWVDAGTGYLMPMQPLVLNTIGGLAIAYTDVPLLQQTGTYPVRYPTTNIDLPGGCVWAQQQSGTTWRWFRFDGNAQEVKKGASDFTAGSNAWLRDAVPAIGRHVDGAMHAYLPADATHITRLNIAALTHAISVVGAIGNRIARWNDRMVSWQVGDPGGAIEASNNLYYSNALDFLTWGAASFYTIGDDQPIQTVVVTPGALLIGKRSGWWELQGTLGSTVSIRQITPSTGPQTEHAHQVSQGQVLYDGFGQRVTCLALQGLYPRTTNSRLSRSRQHFSRVSMSGLLVGFAAQNGPGIAADQRGWIYDAVPSRWYRYKVPSPIFGDLTSTSNLIRWAWDFDGQVQDHDTDWPNEPTLGVLYDPNGSQNRLVFFNTGLRTSGVSGDTIGANVTATVTLAEHQAPPSTKERALEMWVEVVSGPVLGDIICSCQIVLRAKGIPDQTNITPQPLTNSYLWEWHGTQLEPDTRYMIRFTPDELGPATAFVPEITLKNLKLRRVLLALSREQMGPV